MRSCFLLTILLLLNFPARAEFACIQSQNRQQISDSKMLPLLYQENRIQEAIWTLSRMGQHNEARRQQEALENFIASAPVKILKKLENDGFQSEVYLVEVGDGLKAIFKPEFQYWTNKDFRLQQQTHIENEVTVYELAREVGIPVPATTIRNVEGMRGSLQVFVAMGKSPSYGVKTLDLAYDQRLALAPFDYLVDHRDRWMDSYGQKNFVHYFVGNIFLNAYIDNSATLGAQGRFPVLMTNIQPEKATVREMIERILGTLTDEKLQAIVGQRHSQDVVQRTIERRHRLAQMLSEYRKRKKPKP